MKERKLVTSFSAGHIIDSAVSYFYLSQQGWQEKGFLQSSPFVQEGSIDKLIIAKMGIVAALVGTYALAHDLGHEKVKNITEKPLQIGNAAVWAVQAWNALNILTQIIQDS